MDLKTKNLYLKHYVYTVYIYRDPGYISCWNQRLREEIRQYLMLRYHFNAFWVVSGNLGPFGG